MTVVREPATLTLELKSLGIIRWISLNSVYCAVYRAELNFSKLLSIAFH